MIDRKFLQFFNNVMMRLGYYDWTLRIVPDSSEGYCWKGRKIIDIGEGNSNPRQLLIHEISHIGTCRFCNNKHHEFFWRRYRDLMRRFLPGEGIKQSYNEDIGFFRVCYYIENKGHKQL